MACALNPNDEKTSKHRYFKSLRAYKSGTLLSLYLLTTTFLPFTMYKPLGNWLTLSERRTPLMV